MIIIDPEFKSLIPPLSVEEYALLEENLITDGCRDPLVLWNNTIVDGHNRHEICTKYGLAFNTVAIEFEGKPQARIWMRANQIGRRNLSSVWSVDLALGNKADLAEIGAAKYRDTVGRPSETIVINIDNDYLPKHNTQAEIAKVAGVSTGTVAMAEIVMREAPEIWEKAKAGELTIGGAHTQVKKLMADLCREEHRAQIIKKLESISAIEAKEISGVFDVIVIDPPWQMQKIERDVRPNQTELDYPTMSEQELEALEIPTADNCHVWVWTTQKFLQTALHLLDVWGMKYVCTFVWHKPGGFQPFGLPQYNCEFAIYARKGTPKFIDTKAFNLCFNAPRGAHSEKPSEFYEVVRRVTAGRRLDMFNRRPIDGFEVWGKESGMRDDL